jgi:hypothetical protein
MKCGLLIMFVWTVCSEDQGSCMDKVWCKCLVVKFEVFMAVSTFYPESGGSSFFFSPPKMLSTKWHGVIFQKAVVWMPCYCIYLNARWSHCQWLNMWNCLEFKFESFKCIICSWTIGVGDVINKLLRPHEGVEWWVTIGRVPCFALTPAIRIKKPSATFYVCRSHRGSTSAKTTNFTGNVQYVLTEVAGSHSGVTEDSCPLGCNIG